MLSSFLTLHFHFVTELHPCSLCHRCSLLWQTKYS